MRRYAEYALLGLVFVIWIAQGFLPDRGVGVVTGVVIFLISWWMLFLGVLPLNIRGQFEDNDVVEGSEPGAPVSPRIKEKMWLATVLTAGVWLVLFTVLEFGLIDLDSLSWGPSYIEYE
ncbi:DUF1467 family protein [Oceanicaulis sp.]|uniref:DUF1467 family protein n=1 Tax=Oceanicaulis sp. TaxID=1924941 RepID=UPI003F7207D3